ncbi:MAG: hypothetical protein IPI28_18965 [Candidatus Omnitrophica bacterium]|nr:hypothetical protein [Candidatus Omnitrophota bacterium]
MADVSVEAPSVPSTGSTLVEGPNTPKPEATQKAGKGSPRVEKGKEAPKIETPAAKRAFKVKYGDKEETIELDEKEEREWITKAYGADKKFQEAASARKEAQKLRGDAEALFDTLKNGSDEDVAKILADPRIGRNVRAMAEKYLASELEREMMDPKDRELAETKAKLAAIEAEKKAKDDEEKTNAEKEKSEKRVAALKDSIAAKIGEAMKDSPLPKTNRTVAKIAAYMQACVKEEIPYTPAAVVKHVIEDYRADFKDLFASSEASQIAELLGEEVIQKIRKWDNERVTGPKKQPSNGSARPNAFQNQKKKWKTIEEDNLERFGSIYALPDGD